jgi:hypothetical protein
VVSAVTPSGAKWVNVAETVEPPSKEVAWMRGRRDPQTTYDDLIQNNANRIKLLEEMAQRIYREWFVDFRYPGNEGVPRVDSELGPIPQGGWCSVSLNS